MALMTMAEPDPQRENIDHMLAAAGRATRLTKDLRLFGRRQISERRPMDLIGVIGKVQTLLERVIGEDVECRTVLQERPLTVLADAHQIEQVLTNLATNARNAMLRGGVFTIAAECFHMGQQFVAAHGFGKPGAHALITVSDTGTGMDRETRQRIFEPFFTTKEMGRGTGLGLSVVYGILKQHDGYVDVYSEPGNGTTFRIYLSLVEATAQNDQRVPKAEPAAGGTETILLAKDDEMLLALAQRVLRDSGYTVIAAVDGEDAVSKFREHREEIHLLLLDLVMRRPVRKRSGSRRSR